MSYTSILIWILFIVIRYLFNICQSLWWKLSGLSTLLETKRKSDYETSAQVHKILWTRFDDYIWDSSRCFITTHHHFDHPRCVLEDHVSLYYMTATEAVFVRVPSCMPTLYSTRVSPFLILAQIYNAAELITIPISHFHRLADEIGDPSRPVINVNMTGRCGSTLLLQMFEQLPGAQCISEPHAIFMIALMRGNGQVTALEARRLMKSSLRLLCKSSQQTKDDKGSFFVIKQRPLNQGNDQEPWHAFPKSVKHLFVYRTSQLQCALSHWKCTQTTIGGNICKVKEHWFVQSLFPSLSKYISDSIIDSHGVLNDSDRAFDLPLLDMFYLSACRITEPYVRDHAKYRIGGVRYEDLLTNTSNACQAIAKHCDLPTSFAKVAPTALTKDSQSSVGFSREKLKQFQYVFDETINRRLETLCENFDLDGFNKECCLPGTITSH